MRLLSAHLPDVAALGRGDGLAAWTHRADAAGDRWRNRADAAGARPLRRLPRLYGLRHRLPFRRALRPVDRGDPPPDRTQRAAPAERPHLPRAHLRALPPSPADAPATAAALAVSEVGRAAAGAEPMAATDAPAAPAGDGGGAATRPAAAASGALVCADHRRVRRYAAHTSGCVARLCAARLLRRCQRGDGAGAGCGGLSRWFPSCDRAAAAR